MMSQLSPFQHIQLRLIKNARQKKQAPRKMEMNPRTQFNRGNNRNEHAKQLYQAGMAISVEWEQTRLHRQQDNLPEMPEALSLFLRVDPREMPIEDLRKYGIEVIGELEDGFIIGSSSDLSLLTLRDKIEKFSLGAQHSIAGLWDIMDGVAWRRERILSESLNEEWPNIKDHDQLVIEIGVACLGTDEVSDHPKNKQSSYKSDEAYEKAVHKWKDKRDKIYRVWEENMDSRYDQLLGIISAYNGENLAGPINEYFELDSNLPDSFTVKVRVSGKGFKDIVLNYPYAFDIVECDVIEEIMNAGEPDEIGSQNLMFMPPEEDSPAVCVIDSGIQERHVYLKDAIDQTSSRSWINSPTDVADYVSGGHGTRVAGAVLYSNNIPTTGLVTPICWLQNARILNEFNRMPVTLFQPKLMREIVDQFLHSRLNTRIYNHSLNSTKPYRPVHMSAWAATIDQLCWESDILFVVSAGNLNPFAHGQSIVRLSISDHLQGGRGYPNYLLEPSSRVANPAQSLQAITVGSVGISEVNDQHQSFSKYSEPSSFSCAGPGIFQSIKPEVVEFGGCYAFDCGNPARIVSRSELSPKLVSSTLKGGHAISQDRVGTSFAAPKVSHILAAIQKSFPSGSAMLYRALLIQSARWPEWATTHLRPDHIIRHLGYGIPDISRATENTVYRITLITQSDVRISGKQVHIYEVKIPEELSNPANQYDIRVDVTLSYKAQPRRTRRNRQRYLSTWLEWDSSKMGESMNHFLNRMIEMASSGVDSESVIEKENRDTIKWTIHKRSNWGRIKGLKREDSTIQKDWAHIKSYEWGSGFYLAVIGHIGWNRDMDATVPYALTVSFEAINEDIEIYQPIAIVNEINVEVSI
jgi:hypothetical protein